MLYTSWSEETALEVVRTLSAQDGPLLPILRAPQETFGYVEASAVTLVARKLSLSLADVYGVLAFYSDYSDLRTNSAKASSIPAILVLYTSAASGP